MRNLGLQVGLGFCDRAILIGWAEKKSALLNGALKSWEQTLVFLISFDEGTLFLVEGRRTASPPNPVRSIKYIIPPPV